MFGVITLATSKGGAGKSTLARSLAGHWAALGHHPALLDADPQRSLANRYDPNGRLKVPVIAEPEERVSEVIEELRFKHAPVIVDTAGFRNRTTIGALVATDLAIIPLKPAVEDVDAAIATFDLIDEINKTEEREGRPIKVVMVLTMTMRGTVIARHVRLAAHFRRLSAPQGRDAEPRRLSRSRYRRPKSDHDRPRWRRRARYRGHCA